eukprot:1185210-Prorocentrum_minimum.AAC.1
MCENRVVWRLLRGRSTVCVDLCTTGVQTGQYEFQVRSVSEPSNNDTTPFSLPVQGQASYHFTIGTGDQGHDTSARMIVTLDGAYSRAPLELSLGGPFFRRAATQVYTPSSRAIGSRFR